MVERSPQTRPSLLLRLRTDTDREAWQQFADAYAPLVYGFLVRHDMQDADALDVTQDVLAAVARDIKRFEHCAERPGSFRRWLFTIVRHRTIDFQRKEKRYVRGLGGALTFELFSEIEGEDNQLEEQWDKEYQQSLFRTAANKVQQRVREVSWMAFWRTTVGGESPQTVAKSIGVSTLAVYKAKHRILQQVREQIAFLEGESQ